MNTHRMNTSVRWLLTTWLLLAVILTLSGPVSVARAASFVVTNLNDSGTGSLRQAISDANASKGADTITFSVSGTILLSSTLPTITNAAGLTIDGTGQSIAISGNDAVRVMFVDNAAVLTLHNLTVADGNANSSTTFPGSGGGILNYGTLSVTGSTFSGNDGGNLGGAIYHSGGMLTVTDSTFSANSATEGGGIFNYYGTLTVTGSTFSENNASFDGGGIYNGGTLTVTDSTFSGNGASNYGGGIFNGSGTLNVTDSTFSENNAANSGGGIYNNRGTLTATGSIFTGNTASHWGGSIFSWGPLNVADSTFSGNTAFIGGAIGNDSGTVTDSTFSGNIAQYEGGGIMSLGTLDVSDSTFSNNSAGVQGQGGGGIASFVTLDVSDSTFSGNSAPQGGGILNVGGTVTVTGSTFLGNNGGYGGGICNCGVGSTLTVTNSTLLENNADRGGGIVNDANLTVTNSTLSGNFATTNGGGGGISNFGTGTLKNTIMANTTGGNCTNDGSLIDGGGNLSWPDTTCPGLNADPLLGPLQDNGGPTQTLALLAGSPAIDAAVLANCPATDQRGVSRPQGAGCDIGAYESVIYTFSGFFQPVDNLPTFNVVQAGVGVPVRFSLNGDQGLNIFAAGYPDSQQIVCKSGAPQDAIEETVIVGSSSLSYDAASDTYTYLWKTSKAWAGTCRQLNVKLNDGTEHKANFKFVR